MTDNGNATSSDSATVTVEDAATNGPNVSHGNLASVGSDWQTVTLGKAHTSMVIVATPRYNDGSGPGVVRDSNVSGNSFDVRVDNAGSSAFSGDVNYIVVEEGAYDEPGFKLEAVKSDEAQTSCKAGDWGHNTVGYQQSYTSPVVVGQLMSANDEVFSASSGSRTSAPTAGSLNVGKHVAEDPHTTRATETIGYLLIEATQNRAQFRSKRLRSSRESLRTPARMSRSWHAGDIPSVRTGRSHSFPASVGTASEPHRGRR